MGGSRTLENADGPAERHRGAWFRSGGLNAGAGVGRLGDRIGAWGDVMRVRLRLLLVAEMSVAGDGRIGMVFDHKERCLPLYQWK